jgi:uncharacterized protein YjbJ (UPF0337 family)
MRTAILILGQVPQTAVDHGDVGSGLSDSEKSTFPVFLINLEQGEFMNAKTIETNWSELKGKVRGKWGKLTDQDLDNLKTDFGQLSGKIQKAYGIAKDQADQQFNDFKKSVESLMGHAESPIATAAKPVIGAAPLAAAQPAGPVAPLSITKDSQTA